MREGGLEDNTIVAVITMGSLAWDGLMILLCFVQGTGREGVSACSQSTVFSKNSPARAEQPVDFGAYELLKLAWFSRREGSGVKPV
ncbi:hypothetical protein TB1_042324 [Malus domestica]